MRIAPILFVLWTGVLPGCAVIFPVAEVLTRPMDKANTFEEIQAHYASNVRFGLYEQSLPMVEPRLRQRYQAEIPRFREVRFTDVRTESIDLDALKTEARVVVVYRGYWLSSPFEREVRVTQKWRRNPPSQDWCVTPDFEGLLAPTDVSRKPASPPAMLLER